MQLAHLRKPHTTYRVLRSVAAFADEYQANNDLGRRFLIMRFWGLFPELRGGAGGATPGSPLG